jgi:hypothetical protein
MLYILYFTAKPRLPPTDHDFLIPAAIIIDARFMSYIHGYTFILRVEPETKPQTIANVRLQLQCVRVIVYEEEFLLPATVRRFSVPGVVKDVLSTNTADDEESLLSPPLVPPSSRSSSSLSTLL